MSLAQPVTNNFTLSKAVRFLTIRLQPHPCPTSPGALQPLNRAASIGKDHGKPFSHNPSPMLGCISHWLARQADPKVGLPQAGAPVESQPATQ